jgi:hypothetical protein
MPSPLGGRRAHYQRRYRLTPWGQAADTTNEDMPLRAHYKQGLPRGCPHRMTWIVSKSTCSERCLPLKPTGTTPHPAGRPAGDPSRVRPCALQRNARGPRADGYQLAITISLSITKTLLGNTVRGTRWPTMPALAGLKPARRQALKRAWQPQLPSVGTRQHSPRTATAERESLTAAADCVCGWTSWPSTD